MASSSSPCAACKLLRRKCVRGCIYSPFFPPEDPRKFANVHKIFGASNVAKLLNELPPHQRHDAVNSLAYEAAARVRDPVYGCVGAISFLQKQVERLQKELDETQLDLVRMACVDIPMAPESMHVAVQPAEFGRRSGGGDGGGKFYQTPSVHFPYNVSWSDIYDSYGGGMGGSK